MADNLFCEVSFTAVHCKEEKVSHYFNNILEKCIDISWYIKFLHLFSIIPDKVFFSISFQHI